MRWSKQRLLPSRWVIGLIILWLGMNVVIWYWTTAPAEPEEIDRDGFFVRTFRDSSGTRRNYVVFVPKSSPADGKPPVILFLHGSGERGANGIDPVFDALGGAIRRSREEFPFLAVFPQCRRGRSWKFEESETQAALEILGAVLREHGGDPDRVYATGLSMGGAGVWELAAQAPNRFAAVAPICGTVDAARAKSIADSKIPVWSFCGEQDTPLTVEENRTMKANLDSLGTQCQYTELPGVGHHCWDQVYAMPELYQWFLKHRISDRTKK